MTRRMSLGRKIFIWSGSFLLIATFAVFLFRAPVFPLVLAGVFTLIITIVSHWLRRG